MGKQQMTVRVAHTNVGQTFVNKFQPAWRGRSFVFPVCQPDFIPEKRDFGLRWLPQILRVATVAACAVEDTADVAVSTGFVAHRHRGIQQWYLGQSAQKNMASNRFDLPIPLPRYM